MSQFLLETPRLVLRPFIDSDAQAFSRYRSDPVVARYQGWDAPFSLEQARELIAGLGDIPPERAGNWAQIAIVLKSSGVLIGDCAFHFLAEDARQAEIGFTLSASFQGQGYGFEAVSRLVDYLFGELLLHRIRANIDPENKASARLLEKIGLRFEGRWLDSLWFKGGWVSEDWYAMLRREWVERTWGV